MRDGKYEKQNEQVSYKNIVGVALCVCVCVILDYNLSFYGSGMIILSMLRSQRDDNEKVLSAVIFLGSLYRLSHVSMCFDLDNFAIGSYLQKNYFRKHKVLSDNTAPSHSYYAMVTPWEISIFL